MCLSDQVVKVEEERVVVKVIALANYNGGQPGCLSGSGKQKSTIG